MRSARSRHIGQILLTIQVLLWWCSRLDTTTDAWMMIPIHRFSRSGHSYSIQDHASESSIGRSLRHARSLVIQTATSQTSSSEGSSSSSDNQDDNTISNEKESDDSISNKRKLKSRYNLGANKNEPVGSSPTALSSDINDDTMQSSTSGEGSTSGVSLDNLHWNVPKSVQKPKVDTSKKAAAIAAAVAVTAATSPTSSSSSSSKQKKQRRQSRTLVAQTEDDKRLQGAVQVQLNFNSDMEERPKPIAEDKDCASLDDDDDPTALSRQQVPFPRPKLQYPDIDLSIPESVYSNTTDAVWDLLRWEAYQEAQREPLLVSFLYSSILNHRSLESSLAFLLANRLSSAAMISTQIQSLILDAFANDPSIGRSLRADIMAVRDRDPACTCLPDVFLYFKGFHALQTYRVAHQMWNEKKTVLSHYLQSQVSQIFQIDIHPNATLGRGIMLDHGTGIVVGETAHVGHNCSILHHVTLGGSGKKGVDRHPKVGNGVLLGAGASILGNVKLGDGCQVGAGTLVLSDLPSHSVAVGVPAKIIGRFVDEAEQPSIEMDQMMDSQSITQKRLFQTDGI